MELARNLMVESVGRLQPPPPLCLGHDASVRDAVDLMRLHRAGCVLVCRAGRLAGLFTQRDLPLPVLSTDAPPRRPALAPARGLSGPLSDCMTAAPVVVRQAESIGSAIRLM